MSEYGIRIYSEDFKQMRWNEFCALLAGLSAESPLGRIVQIRCENDPKVIERFTTSQRRIRDEWRRKTLEAMSEESVNEALEYFKNIFKGMAGGE